MFLFMLDVEKILVNYKIFNFCDQTLLIDFKYR